MMLEPGDAIPAVTLMDMEGVEFALDHYSGKPLVVYFYPKADTPGCTNEAKLDSSCRKFARRLY